MDADDLFAALSAEPPAAVPRPDAVQIITRSVAAARRRRARATVAASIGAVVILVAGIAGSVLTFDAHRSNVPEPAQVSVTPAPLSTVATSAPSTIATSPTRPTAPPTTAGSLKATPPHGATASPAGTHSRTTVVMPGDGTASQTAPSTTARSSTPATGPTSARSSASSLSVIPPSTFSTTSRSPAVTTSSTAAQSYPEDAYHPKFQLPSGNIACDDTEAETETCWIYQIDFVPTGEAANCPTSAPVYELTARMPVRGNSSETLSCSTGPESSAWPVLQYGQTNVGEAARCVSSKTAGVTCRFSNTLGDPVVYGFSLSRSGFARIGSPPPPTVVTVYDPWRLSGFASGITVAQNVIGTCTGPSEHPECTDTQGHTYDPCFLSPDRKQAICPGRTPYHVTVMTLTANSTTDKDPTTEAWELDLSTGQKCFISDLPEDNYGERIYVCDSGLLFANPVQRRDTWTGQYTDSTQATESARALSVTTSITRASN